MSETCSATAAPAFSIRVSEGTPNFSLVTRSMSRISAALTIFMGNRLSCGSYRLFQLPQLRGLSHGDEAVLGLDPLIGRGIEAHGIAPFDRQHDDAALLSDARGLERFAGELRTRSNVDFSNLQIHAQMRRGRVQKGDHVWPQQRLCDALACKGVRGNDGIGTGCEQVFFRRVFAGACN